MTIAPGVQIAVRVRIDIQDVGFRVIWGWGAGTVCSRPEMGYAARRCRYAPFGRKLAAALHATREP